MSVGRRPRALRLTTTAGAALASLMSASTLLPVAPAAADDDVPFTVDRVVRDSRLAEASGLAVDPYRSDVIWMQNDSGNRAELFALARDGRTRTRVTVKGAGEEDWEALQSWRGPGGRGLLVVADIGDNRAGRETVRLLAVPVSPDGGHVTTSPDAVVTLTYPDGPHDAEAFLLDPRDGRCYVVTKGLFTGTLYAVPPDVWTARSWRPGAATVRRRGELVKLADIPMGLVTDGAMLADGRIVLRNYGEVNVFDPPARLGSGMADRRAEADLPEQEQGEGLTVVAGRGGRAELLLGSEGRKQPLLRVELPVRDAAPPPVATRPRTTPPGSRPASGQAKAASADADLAPADDERHPLLVPGIIAAVVIGGYWYARKRKK